MYTNPVASCERRCGAPHARSSALAALLAALLCACSHDPAPRKDLDVLVVTIDALRADHLGAYGYGRPTSPILDRFADDATLFERAIVQWPRTTPSLTSMMTGKYPFSTGVMGPSRGHFIRDENRMLAEVLRESGFSTFAVVTNGCVSSAANFLQGFDEFHETYLHPDLPAGADAVTAIATERWRKRAGKARIFAWVHYLEPHWAYNAPSPYRDMFVADAYHDPNRFVSEPRSPDPEPGSRAEEGTPEDQGETADRGGTTDRDEEAAAGPEAEPRRRRPARKKERGILGRLFDEGGGRFNLDDMIARYDGEIRYADTHVGALLDTFRREGWLETTLVIISADHGEGLGEHDYYFDHGGLPYSDCTHVPLIVRHPDPRLRPRWISYPTEMVNLFPTILDLAGIPIPEEVQGSSLVPVLLGKKNAVRRYAFTMAGEARTLETLTRAAVLDGRYELVWNVATRKKKKGQIPAREASYELYDLLSDPHEKKDLLARGKGGRKSAAEEEARRLRAALDAWLEEAKAKPRLEPASRRPKYGLAIEENLRALGYVK